MTVRALRAVEQAELLIWADSLVAPEIAALAPANCERLRSGNLTLEVVMDAMLDGIRRGKRVSVSMMATPACTALCRSKSLDWLMLTWQLKSSPASAPIRPLPLHSMPSSPSLVWCKLSC